MGGNVTVVQVSSLVIESAAVADVDGDGLNDIVVGVASGFDVLYGQGGGTFSGPVPFALNPAQASFDVVSLSVADLNGDGRPDVVAGGFNSNGGYNSYVYIALNNGGRTFSQATMFNTNSPSEYSYPYRVATMVADVTGDGQPDIVTSHIAGGAVAVLRNLGDGTFAQPTTQSFDLGHYQTPSGTAPYNGSYLIAYLGDGYVLAGNGVRVGRLGDDARAIAVTDVNGDGLPDIVLADEEKGAGVLFGQPGGTFSAPTILPAKLYSRTESLAVGDINADGLPDIVVGGYDGGNGYVGAFLNKGNGTFDALREVILPYAVSSVSLSRFDDGRGVEIVAAGRGARQAGVSLIANAQDATPLCFLRGTRILTPTGQRPIEALRIGDPVVTRWHGTQPVRWVGKQSYRARFLRSNPAKAPIRIRTGALADHVPARDLFVTPGHSMLVDGRLVLTSSLLNGVTVTWAELPDQVDYFQIELACHECVVAEGAWSETYAAGDGLREQFHNAREFEALYPDHRDPEELVLCAPRPERGARLNEALFPVVARAAALVQPGPLDGVVDLVPTPWKVEGWALDRDHPDLPVLLELLDGEAVLGTTLAADRRSDLEQAELGGGRCAFQFLLDKRIAAERMHGLRVRRVGDRAELAMSAACHERIRADHGARWLRPTLVRSA